MEIASDFDVREVRGQGSARARMSMAVTGQDAAAHVGSTTTVELSGRAAQMGAGIVEDVAARLVADMAVALEALLATEPAAANRAAGETPPAAGATATAPTAPPIGGLRLLVRALWHRLRHGRARAPRQDRS